MPEFRTIKEMNKWIEQNLIVQVLEKIAIEIKGVLRNNLLNHWYKTYEPQYYERTDMLINSIECKKAEKVNGYWQIEIWFNPDKIVAQPASQAGFFPAHSNITDGKSSYNGMSYGELLPWWVEEGQHSPIHSYIGVHMVEDTIDWAKQDNYLKNRMKEILDGKGYKVI